MLDQQWFVQCNAKMKARHGPLRLSNSLQKAQDRTNILIKSLMQQAEQAAARLWKDNGLSYADISFYICQHDSSM